MELLISAVATVLVDLVDLDAGQLDERAAGAGAFLTGDDSDGIAAAVAAAGGEAQRHGADDADGKNCFEDLFHNSKLLLIVSFDFGSRAYHTGSL